MRGAWRRPPRWLVLGIAAAALQVLALVVATWPHYVNRLAGIYSCPTPSCVVLAFDWVPTYPYIGLGILLFVAGAALMAAAILLAWRAPRRPDPGTASA